MIITLCGSTRFEEAWHTWNERLTIDGHTVFSLTVFPSIKGKKDWHDEQTKKALDAAHFRKIDASDTVFVITGHFGSRSRYIGDSTRREIAHALETKKQVYYADQSCGYAGCSNRLNNLPPCPMCYE